MNNSDRHRIIYLAPNDFKHPEPHSYTRPNKPEEFSRALPEQISYQFLTFSRFCSIFSELLKSEHSESNPSPIHPQNFRLIGFLTTYFDLWN
jgi:predicted alternative tryptophan synthase beta-subunit